MSAAKNIDDVAQTLAEYERLAITSGAKVRIDPPEFSAGAADPVDAVWAPYWLDKQNPPALARAAVWRDDVPTTVYVSWDESLPIETAQTDDGRLWRDLWEKNPMQRFGSYALRTALRRAFREVIGDRVEPDEDAPKVPGKDTEPAAPRDWLYEMTMSRDVYDLDALWREMRAHHARTPKLEVEYKALRETLTAAEWEPAETIAKDTAPEIKRPAPQDHLPSNRAERRAAAKRKGRGQR